MSVFIYRGPLPPDSPMFRGRTTELTQLTRLCQREVEAYAIVYGGRQTGKTSLLLRLANNLPAHVRTQVQRVFYDSAAAEQAARMTSMEAATKNAGEMIDNLTLLYNRTRQAAITKELIEIVSGAQALGE